MATFGTPFAGNSDACNALRCAQAMLGSVDELNLDRDQDVVAEVAFLRKDDIADETAVPCERIHWKCRRDIRTRRAGQTEARLSVHQHANFTRRNSVRRQAPPSEPGYPVERRLAGDVEREMQGVAPLTAASVGLGSASPEGLAQTPVIFR